MARSYRRELTAGEDVIDPATWAGSVPQANGIAPRVRIGASRWFNLLWLLPIGFALLLDPTRAPISTAGSARPPSSFASRVIGRHLG